MDPLTRLTWLHLSDWQQRGESFDRQAMVEGLLQDVREREKISPDLAALDLIVFSGDVAYAGKAEEYAAAKRALFDPLLGSTGLDREQVFLVPGNHDLDLAVLTQLPSDLQKPFTSNAQVQEWLTDESRRAQLLRPFAAYAEFVRSQAVLKQPEYAAVQRLSVGGRRLALLGLNSAWMGGRIRDADGRLQDEGYALVGEPQVDAVLDQAGDADVRIAVLHHPFDWLANFDRELVERRLVEGCHFILHGHQQEPRVYVVSEPGGGCVIIPTGIGSERLMTGEPHYTGTYNLVSLDFGTGRGVVYLRRWDERQQHWAADTESHEGGRFEFDLPKGLARRTGPARGTASQVGPAQRVTPGASPPTSSGTMAAPEHPQAVPSAEPLAADPLGRTVEVDGRPVAVKVWQGEGYHVEGPFVDSWPHVMLSNAWAPVHVRAFNPGPATWEDSGPQVFQVGYITWPQDPSLGPGRAKRWPLPRSIRAGESLVEDQPYDGPDVPGRYRVEWALLRGENPGEVTLLRGEKPAILALQVAGLDELLAALPELPKETGSRQMWWIRAIGQAARQEGISPTQRQVLIEQGLIPALFSRYITVRRPAWKELAQFKRPDPDLEALLRQTFDQRQAELDPVRALLNDSRVPVDARNWLKTLLPPKEAEPAPKPTTKEPKAVPSRAKRQAKPATGPASGWPPGISPQTPAGPQVGGATSLTVVNLAIYDPPPRLNLVTLDISATTVKLTYGRETYSGPNRLDPVLLRASLADRTEYGQRLFQGIVHGEPSAGGLAERATLDGYHQALREHQRRLRLELRLDPNDYDLHEQRWEYLNDPARQMPLAVLEQSPFYRFVEGPTRELFIREDRQLKVLVALCNPTSLKKPGNSLLEKLDPLDLTQERTIVRTALEPLQGRLVQYKVLDRDGGAAGKAPTLDVLREELQKGYHVLHLVAHGLSIQQGNAKGFFLVMERADGREQFVSAQDFKLLLQAAAKLRLVVLASCRSAVSDGGNAMRGLGPRLVREAGVPAVIAMQEDLPVPTAQLFTQHFYDDLARSGRVDMAMAATRLALFMKEDATLGNWGIPVLLMSTSDGQLLEVDRDKAARTPRREPVIKSAEELAGRADTLQQVVGQLRTLGLIQEATTVERATGMAAEQELAPPQKRDELDKSLTLDKNGMTMVGRRPARVRAASRGSEHEKRSLQDWVEAGAELQIEPLVYDQIAASLNTGKHIVLIGPPGTGKTSLAQAIGQYAAAKGWATGVALTTATADWTTFDTVGGYVPTPAAGQALQFRAGAFLRAICKGEWLVIDEINRAEIDKAFGELFTVVSGQPVEFPYWVGRDQVCVLPARWKLGDTTWIPNGPLSCYEYVVHPCWRIIGTMNVYDKSSLFAMSLAFMRRFAFIDLELPKERGWKTLFDRWFAEQEALQAAAAAAGRWLLEEKLRQLLDLGPLDRGRMLAAGATDPPDRAKVLMQRRAMGPAIVRDMISYVSQRYAAGDGAQNMERFVAEAFLLYAAPQLDGLDREAIRAIYKELDAILAGEAGPTLRRIRDLYPYFDKWT